MLKKIVNKNHKIDLLKKKTIPLRGNFTNLAMWYITLQVGSPPHEETVQLDTGSADIGIPQEGCKCGRHPGAEWDPSRAFPIFCDSRILQCKSSDGQGAFCKGNERFCAYQIEYGDGSGFYAQVYNDTVSIGGQKITSQNIGGIYKENTGGDGPFEPYAIDGIAGFGFKSLSVVGSANIMDNLSAEDASCANTFSMCGDQNGGVFTICGYGDHHSGDIQWTPMTQLNSGFYNIFIYDLSVYGKRLGIKSSKYNNGLSTVDSGTSAAYFPADAYKELEKRFVENCSEHYLHGVCDVGKNETIFDSSESCFSFTPEQIKAYPNITMLVGKSDSDRIEVVFTPESYLLLGNCNNPDQYSLGIVNGGPSGSLLGDPIMIANEVVYDIHNKRMGFAPKLNCGAH